MKKLFFIFAFFILFLNNQSYASHIGGGEVTYRCVGNGQFEFTTVIYHPCPVIANQSAVTSIISSVSCNTAQILTLFLDTSYYITFSCPGAQSTCESLQGSVPGLLKSIYKNTLLIHFTCNDWQISSSISARNGDPTTIIYPNSENLFISAILNNIDSVSACNTSPFFNNEPIIFACINQPVCIDPGIIDVDGDSLVCSLTAPYTDVNNTLSYYPGYSNIQPVSSAQPVTIDPISGIICFTPTQHEATILVWTVKEFRNGIQIGQVTRDVMLYISNCANHQPTLSGFLGTPAFTLTICAGMQTCLPVYSGDVDADDTTIITWDQGIPSATFINSGGQFDAGLFCWQPDSTFIRSNPYCFNATVFDNGCLGSKTKTVQYCIFVVDSDATCISLSAESNQKEILSLKIFPQPATDLFYIDLGNETTFNEKYKIKITDILGKEIYQAEIKNQITEIDSYNWTSGLHIVYLLSDESGIIKREKLIVMK